LAEAGRRGEIFGGEISAVAQIGNLLYRRLSTGMRVCLATACGLPIRDTAGCQPALHLLDGFDAEGFQALLQNPRGQVT
jgi:hypothetical protein